MIIKHIRTGGFANIDDVTLHDNMSSVFVAPNNYGKSNVLAAVSFGVRFMCALENEKRLIFTVLLIDRVRWCQGFAIFKEIGNSWM